LRASVDMSATFLRDLHTPFLSEHFEACIKAGTSLPSVGCIRKDEIWQLTKRGWCKKAFVIKYGTDHNFSSTEKGTQPVGL